MNDEVKALKEKIKKKNETIKRLNKLVKYHKENNYMYEDWYNNARKKISLYENLMPDKFYKITYQMWKEGQVVSSNTALYNAPHYSFAISKLRQEALNKEMAFKLVDILEVAS